MQVSKKIGVGSVQFGTDYGISNVAGKTAEEEVSRILTSAKNEGLTLIDTASAYGDAEEVLGKNNLSGFFITSKFINGDSQNIEQLLNSTLKKLQADSLYGYMAHRSQELTSDQNLWPKLRELKNKGKIRKIGVSFNEIEEVDILLDSGVIPDIIQAPYNYFDHRFYETFKLLKKYDCEIHSRSAFLQGLFFCNTEKLSSFFNPVRKEILLLQEKYKENLSGVLLNYCLKNDFIDKVIIGVNNAEQLLHNISSVKNTESVEMDELEKDISENIVVPSKWSKVNE